MATSMIVQSTAAMDDETFLKHMNARHQTTLYADKLAKQIHNEFHRLHPGRQNHVHEESQ